MDDPLPAYLTPEFLDDFKILPNSFYSPDAPEKFEAFILRWGTHVVKSAKFGGKFSMKRTTKNDGTVKVEDFQRETQNEFDRVTASSYGKASQETASGDQDTKASVSGGSGGNSASASGAGRVISKFDNNTEQTNDATSATAQQQAQGGSGITEDKKKISFDQMTITAEGGSHLVAAAMSDIYSPSFKETLKQWLESVPKYPKPFDMHFQPLSDMLYGLTNQFIDKECQKQCYATVGEIDPSLLEGKGENIDLNFVVQAVFLLITI